MNIHVVKKNTCENLGLDLKFTYCVWAPLMAFHVDATSTNVAPVVGEKHHPGRENPLYLAHVGYWT